MGMAHGDYGEVHCLLCGRYLADIEAGPAGQLRLRRPKQGERAAGTVSGGRLHCGKCGGRAFVEWDLLFSGSTSTTRQAA